VKTTLSGGFQGSFPGSFLAVQAMMILMLALVANYKAFPGWEWGRSENDIICYAGDCGAPHGYTPPTIDDNMVADLCDKSADCEGFVTGYSDGPCLKVPGVKNATMTTYVHTTRCTSTSQATNYTSAAGQVYKACTGTDAYFDMIAHYLLPPYICAQTCDRDPNCAAYTRAMNRTASHSNTCSTRLKRHILQSEVDRSGEARLAEAASNAARQRVGGWQCCLACGGK
jgi:hypothetical protein